MEFNNKLFKHSLYENKVINTNDIILKPTHSFNIYTEFFRARSLPKIKSRQKSNLIVAIQILINSSSNLYLTSRVYIIQSIVL